MESYFSSFIDHTLLKPDATSKQITQLCEEAKKYQFAAVCVHPTWIELASELLDGTRVKVATVVGFPLGATTTEAKVFEAKDAVEKGATEVDMVINIGRLKGNDDGFVENDIRSVVKAVEGKAIVKVIIETSLLTNSEKVLACSLAFNAGADFVKTSTGFSSGGATIFDIKLMREAVGPKMGIKASGGIKDHATAMEMIEAGATRIGTSSGVKLLHNND